MATAELDRRMRYKSVFSSEDGKKVLDDLVLRARVFGPCDTQIQEGARRFVLDILSDVTEGE